MMVASSPYTPLGYPDFMGLAAPKSFIFKWKSPLFLVIRGRLEPEVLSSRLPSLIKYLSYFLPSACKMRPVGILVLREALSLPLMGVTGGDLLPAPPLSSSFTLDLVLLFCCPMSLCTALPWLSFCRFPYLGCQQCLPCVF